MTFKSQCNILFFKVGFCGCCRPRESGGRTGERTTWSGDATKNKDFNYVSMDDKVTISLGEEEGRTMQNAAPVKETPIWMKRSTVEGAVSEPLMQVCVGLSYLLTYLYAIVV